MDTISTENLSNILATAKTFAIITHTRPDGDAISSSLAIFWHLTNIGKPKDNIDVIIPEFLDDFSFIPGIEYIKANPSKENYDVVIVVDVACMHLIEGADALRRSNCIICFDHHDETTIAFSHGIVDCTAPSCTCIIYETFNCTDKNFLTCIATGLISDTNNLTLNTSNTGKEIIKYLTEIGVDIKFIIHKLTSPSNRTISLAKIAKDRGFFSGSIFCTFLTQEDLLSSEKSLNTVNHKSIIAELQKSIKYDFLIFTIMNDKEEWKGSVRALNSNVDLNKICSELVTEGKFIKGGGHSYSAGFTAVGKLDTIFETMISRIQK